MSVNLKVDSNTYEDASKIVVGGKTIDIIEVEGSIIGEVETQEITDSKELGQYGGIVFNVKQSGCYLYVIRPHTKPTIILRNPYVINVYIDNDNGYYRAGYIGYTGAGYVSVVVDYENIALGTCKILGDSSLWLNKDISYTVTEMPLSSL